jgi:hypothetical protein
MKVEPGAAAKTPGFLVRRVRIYEDTTGQFAITWLLLALLNLVTQIVFFRDLSPSVGEFGTFNAALGIIGLLVVPVLAVQKAFRLFFARAQPTRLDSLRRSAVTVTETFAWIWGACCFILILLPLPLPALPRFALELFTLMNVLLALGAVISSALSDDSRQRRRWALLLVVAAGARLVIGGWFAAYQPWAEAPLTAYLVAGFITLLPALRPREINAMARLKACAAVLNRDFLLFTGATLSVLLGLYLFTNADRIASLRWMNMTVGETVVPNAVMEASFDRYQATGLLARALLWGTQPLLWIFYAERSPLDRTTPASLKFFWIYLATLLAGIIVLDGLTHQGPRGGLLSLLGNYGPTFAIVMLPLGLLQGLGIFALASRRYPECFVLGGCGLLYALILALFGRRPDTMLQIMFGVALISLMIVLAVGVVRWGRKQP